MATLYDQVSSNNRKTFFLIFFFLMFVILLGWLFSYVFDNVFILYISVAISIVMSFASYYNSHKIILSMTGAKLVSKENNKELYRIIENLAITAGMKTPQIYIINETQPNAFATGRDEEHAVIAVTKGLLEKLNKRELEGVLAHELAHIKNKDILVGSVVVVLVGIVVLLSDTFSRSLLYGRSRDNDKNPILLIIAILSMVLAPIAATIIKLAISRKQEFRADGTGALLTRDPDGLISALIKISSDKTPLTRANSAMAHLYISSPLKEKNSLNKLFMTHPPIEDRIKALKGI